MYYTAVMLHGQYLTGLLFRLFFHCNWTSSIFILEASPSIVCFEISAVKRWHEGIWASPAVEPRRPNRHWKNRKAFACHFVAFCETGDNYFDIWVKMCEWHRTEKKTSQSFGSGHWAWTKTMSIAWTKGGVVLLKYHFKNGWYCTRIWSTFWLCL